MDYKRDEVLNDTIAHPELEQYCRICLDLENLGDMQG